MARSSRQRGEMVCTVCQTRTSPLWRRGDKGEVLCNACGLYHKHHKKPRPISLANSSARSSRRNNHQNTENKVPNQRYPNIYPNPNMVNSTMRPYPYQQAIAPALTPVNATGSTLKSGNSISPTLPHSNMFSSSNNSNMYNQTSSNSHNMSTLSPTFKMATNIGSGAMPIPIKKNMMTTSAVASPPLSSSLSPPTNTPLLFKMNNSSNQNNNSELILPAPFIQKNNSEHYYGHESVKPMDMDSKEDFMSSDNESISKYQSKTSIASILNTETPNNNNYHKKYNSYNALPTPITNSPTSGNSYMNENEHYFGQNEEDIEAAQLLISLRNCEKVC